MQVWSLALGQGAAHCPLQPLLVCSLSPGESLGSKQRKWLCRLVPIQRSQHVLCLFFCGHGFSG